MVVHKIRKQVHDIQRLGQILKTLSKYGFEYIVDRLNLDYNLLHFITKIKDKKETPQSTLPLGTRLKKVAEELGPTFIKLAQLISTRPDLIPYSICKELESLQDQVSPISWKEIKPILKKEFSDSFHEIFSSFEEKPFAAASLSQVHNAKLKDGTSVAVKIQRPQIKEMILSDLTLLKYLAHLADRYIEETKRFEFPKIIDEFTKSILRELDFSQEARNVERFCQNFSMDKTIHTMTVYRDYSSDKILTMEKITGIKISHFDELKKAGYSLPQLAKQGTIAVLRQIFEFGFFHGDPHPGNLFVLPGQKLTFIDLGLMGKLDRETMDHLADLLYVIIQKDLRGILKVLKKINIIDELFDSRNLRIDLYHFLDEYQDVPLKHLSANKLFHNFFELLLRNHLSIPPEFTLLIKSIATVEGLAREMHPDLNIFEEAAPFVENLLKKRYSPKRIASEIQTTLSELLDFIRLFPSESKQLLARIKSGRLKIEFHHQGLEDSMSIFSQTVNRVSMAIVLASLIIGSSLIVLSKIPPKIYGIPLIGILGFLFSGLLGLYLLYSIYRHGKM